MVSGPGRRFGRTVMGHVGRRERPAVKLLIRPAPPTGPGPATTSGQVATKARSQSAEGSHSQPPSHSPAPSGCEGILTVGRAGPHRGARRSPATRWRPGTARCARRVTRPTPADPEVVDEGAVAVERLGADAGGRPADVAARELGDVAPGAGDERAAATASRASRRGRCASAAAPAAGSRGQRSDLGEVARRRRRARR